MDLASVVLFIILPLTAALYLFLKKKYSYFEEKAIPYVKPSWLFGNMSGVGRNVHVIDVFSSIYNIGKKEGDVIAGAFTMTIPSIVVIDLELVKSILVRDFNNFSDRGMYVDEEGEPLTGNLFQTKSEKWRF